MTEEEALTWLDARFDEEARAKLDRYVSLLLAENESQNLISRGSVPQIWSRHIVDSAQLPGFAPEAKSWLDVGSGPGLPGLVLAILTRAPITLVEPRARRADFLERVISDLQLQHVSVEARSIERIMLDRSYGAITARAFASLDQTIASTKRFADSSTIWVLPRGRSGRSELEAAKRSWQGVFHVEHSVTNEQALIVVASQVRREKQ